MRPGIGKLALYTTVYPGVEPFLSHWYRSVRSQSDSDFRLWVSLDGLGAEAVMDAMGGDPRATWVRGLPGNSPAQIRQRALARVVESFDAVVLVDSDDVLHPDRVASARGLLMDNDVVGCSLRLVDVSGRDLGEELTLPSRMTPQDILPRNNVYGLSNSAYRCDVLRWCLPIPRGVELVDWFLVTRAWLRGARLGFDPELGMDYRQHEGNTARVRSPFSERQVVEDTMRVRRHFRLLESALPADALPDRRDELCRVAADIDAFHEEVVRRPDVLARYVEALGALDLPPLWWSCVAHPSLRGMWGPDKEGA